MGLGNLDAFFKAFQRSKQGIVRGWGSTVAQCPELAEWGEELEGKGDKPHWACSAVSLAAVQTKVLDTVHWQAFCQEICSYKSFV